MAHGNRLRTRGSERSRNRKGAATAEDGMVFYEAAYWLS